MADSTHGSTLSMRNALSVCNQCPGLTRDFIGTFCDLPFINSFKDKCLELETKNTDEQLKNKVCKKAGFCGKSVSCAQCPKAFKNIVITMCDSLTDNLIEFGAWTWSYADFCKFPITYLPVWAY